MRQTKGIKSHQIFNKVTEIMANIDHSDMQLFYRHIRAFQAKNKRVKKPCFVEDQ